MHTTVTTHKRVADRFLVSCELLKLAELGEGILIQDRPRFVGGRIAGGGEVRIAELLPVGEDGSVRHIVRKLRSILLEILASFFSRTERVRVVAVGDTFGERSI